MFLEKIKNILGLPYKDYILVKDLDKILMEERIIDAIVAEGYTVIFYKDVEEFRYIFESQIKTKGLEKVLLILNEDIYVAYDIIKWFSICNLNYGEIFSRLNRNILSQAKALDLDLISIVYENTYEDYSSEEMTHKFLNEIIYEDKHLMSYLSKLEEVLKKLMEKVNDYDKWFKIAYLNARRNLIMGKLDLEKRELVDFSKDFQAYIFKDFGSLSGKSTYKGPILVSNVMDFLLRRKKKTAFIVLDGMSISDWLVLERNLDYKAKTNFVFAMIPTVTSISRQSLLAGLLPQELEKPFSLANEKKQYYSKVGEYLEESYINYYRGYDIEPSYKDFFITTVINEIDDLVHRQMYGMEGHITDIARMGQTGKLNKLIGKLLGYGFEVYIGSDHGNKESFGIGSPKGMGVEVETKSKKMMIIKDYVDIEELVEEYNLLEYPSYYLPKDYSYLLCGNNEALALEGTRIMSHGGISIEEVIVPFIKIEGEENNE
ncbi:MAG: PglZ domain-containing protein [Epulopiscium sp.]|nr:PglZ domain-containing protein [Candidatus Epulonipiscium sp.]